MRRAWLAFTVAVLVLVVAVTAVAAGGGDDDEQGYRVRAIFDNASFLIPGEDVKVGGVIVGKIAEVELDRNNKAVVVLNITDPGFQDFRQDATCEVGLQSLIGEQFVECQPTQKRGEGVTVAPTIKPIASGPGKGQYLIPVDRTSSPVGPDLLANIMRVPQRERFRLILAELGTGLAGNGPELRDVIQRANPTLQQANRLVEILANQNKTIASLVEQSDQALAPLAERRGDLAGFIRTSGRTAAAAAAEGDALEENFARLPQFLRELKPAANRIGRLSDQIGPSVANLSAQAGPINTAVTQLGPFSRAATPALTSLGDVAQQGRKTFTRIDRLVTQLNAAGAPLAPLAKDLAELGDSFDRTGGIANILRVLYLYTGSLNGKDGIAHYTRTLVYASACVERVPDIRLASCLANFNPDDTGASEESDAETRAVRTAAPATGTAARTKATLDTLLGPEGTK
jgi:ABC-type transporter Mla subunit MlaD